MEHQWQKNLNALDTFLGKWDLAQLTFKNARQKLAVIHMEW